MKNIKKSIFIRIMSLFLILLFIFPIVNNMKFNFINFKTDAEETVITNLDNVYGITYANIDTFAYYEYNTGQYSHNEYGAGMEIKFKLPREAKEGDYFTLNYGEQLLLNKMPMYADNETVPYDSLDSQPNRYNNKQDNIFFVVKTEGDGQNPQGVPLLNVYYTKKGELTFVVQKYANDKGVIEGETIIGELMNDPSNVDSPLNKRFSAITDGNGRHVRKGQKKLNWDVDDLETQLSNRFFTGFRPNNLLMRVQAGAALVNNQRAFIKRDITYTSKYMNANLVKLNDANGDTNKSGMYVNYETDLFKSWGGNNVTSFGKEHLYPHYEDREYIYYHFVYQANKGTSDATAAANIGIYPVDNTVDIEEIKLFRGFDSNGSLNFTNDNPSSIVPPMAYYDVGQTVQGLSFQKQYDGKWYADFKNHQKNTYFGVIKARKKTPSTFEGKDAYKIRMFSYQSVIKRRTHYDYYTPTSNLGYGLAEIKISNDTFDFTVSKRIKGIENTGRHITTEMEFKLSKIGDDTFSPQVIKKNANENFVFTGLTKGEYLLEETAVPAGYVIDNCVYKLILDNDGNIHFFKLSSPNTNYTYAEFQKTLIKHELLNQYVNGTTDNNAIDGNLSTSTIWHQTDPGNTLNGVGTLERKNNNIRVGTYVGVDLGEAKLINEIKFMQGQSNNSNDRLVKFDMEYSVDNTNWKTYKSYSDDNTNQGDVNENGLALYARYIRFVNKEPVLNKWFSVKEISTKVYENINKTITLKMQENPNIDENIAFVGNIQNPSLVLEKVDADKNLIVKNNDGKDYNSKFKLYKVPDEKESITEEELSNLTQVQEFTLNQGKTELKQLADKLGRYVLVETESPNGYSKVEPILLDLVETQQDHGGGIMKNTTAWKIVGNSTQLGNSSSATIDGYPIYTGTAENDKIFVDYSKLSTNKITLKVKNEKDSKKIKIKIKKVDKDKNPIIIKDDNKSPRFMITKDPNATYESGAYNGQVANLNSDDGSFTFDNRTNKFEKGLYYLRELRAPTGYVLLDKSIPFYIEENGNVVIPAKLKEGTTGEYIEDEKFSLKDKINVIQAGETEIVQIEVVNDKAFYPKAGGYGVLKYVLIGSLFMCLSTAVVIKKKYYDK